MTTPLLLTMALLLGSEPGPEAEEPRLDPSVLAGMQARSIGPAGMSGRVAAVEAVAGDPNVIYVGAATGGVWKSTDAGLTWTPIFDDQPVAAIGAIAVCPTNPDLVWVGTGEGNPRNSASVGNGIYRSRNAGKAWEHLGLEQTERIHRIVPHPTDPDTAFVAAMGRAWGENPERGVYRTTDGGTTWDRVLFVDEKTGCADLVMDPSNPDHLLAAMWQYRRWPWIFTSGGPGSGLFESIDGGDTWERKAPEDGMPEGDLGRIGLAFSASDPDIAYALVEAEESALLRSEDGGDTWQSVNTSTNVAPRPFYYADIRVDPERPDRVYNLHSLVEVSDDGGRTFRTLVSFLALHPDHHALWIDPEDPRHLILGNDGGVGISRDRGRSWQFARNLPLAQFYHIAVDDEVPYHVYGGLQDNGSWRGPSSVWEGGLTRGIRDVHWRMVDFGDGFDTLPDPERADRGYAMSQGGALSRWDLTNGETKSIRPDGPEGVELRFNWNAGIAQDPFDPGTIYYGSQFVHRSTDRGETWETISEDLTTNTAEWQRQDESGGLTLDVTAAENFTTIVAIAPSPVGRGVLWVGTDDGRVHVSRDGGEAWASVEGNVLDVPRNSWVPHITPSKFDESEAFVVFDNHRRSDLSTYAYRVSDSGKGWTRLNTEGVRGYALKIEQDPVDPSLLFLGTEFGLYVSTDGGKGWFRWTHGVPTVSVMDMAIQARTHDLVLGTHGRSVFILDDIGPLREVSAGVLAEPLHLFPIPEAQQYRPSTGPGGIFTGSNEYRGENRPYGALITFSINGEDLPHPDQEVERVRTQERRLQAREAAESSGDEETPAPEEVPEAVEEEAEGEESEAEEEPEEAPPAKVRLTIRDASGEVVRTIELEEPYLGVNRVAWNLRRDEFERPKAGGSEESEFASLFGGGPEVIPGEYAVTIRFGEHEAEGAVVVVPDPRDPIAEADRLAQWEAVRRAGRLQETIAEAVERIIDTRDDVDAILARLDRGEKEGEGEGEAEEDGDGEAEEDAEEGPPAALETQGARLKDRLDAIERRLWVPPDTKGIVAEDDALSAVSRAMGMLESSWEAPNATQRSYLEQAEARLRPVLDDLNALFAGEVSAFRSRVREAAVELLPEVEPIAVDPEG